jgi:hypothetical protein
MRARSAWRLAGPALIVASVLIAMRGFAFENLLTNQHPDILSFWLPRTCLMGRALSAGHVPVWNPYEMLGTPFAADPQSGWLYAPQMLLSWLFGCGGGLRAFIVLQPILAGLGTFWFLRRERLGVPASTAGGLSVAMLIASSNVAISLPFAGTLAWTPFVLVGASGWLSAETWPRRMLWLALGAFAWSQVASAHLSHGLLMCTGLVTAYLIARAIHETRAGSTAAPRALLMTLGFLAFLPLASLAVLVPRFALIARSSLRGGYASLGGTLARAAGVEDRPLPTRGIWSAWPWALGTTPGTYAGAAILLGTFFALRDRARRFLVVSIGVAGLVAYLLTLNLFVGATWFRELVLRLPFGDVYLHNPGRLRYLALLVVPILGAIGLNALIERPPQRRAMGWMLGLGVVVILAVPVALGAVPARFIELAIACLVTVPILIAVATRRRWAVPVLVGAISLDLLTSAVYSSIYQGGTVFIGLEGRDHPTLVSEPLRWPDVHLDRYLDPGPIARTLQRRGPNDGRYLAWIQPASNFNKGYLFSQRETDWPAMLLGRAILFRLHDVLGYSPIQLPRYWSYIRATNPLPVFYNASILSDPTMENLRLLGIRYLIVPKAYTLPPGISGREVVSERGYELYEVDGWQPRVSVVSNWRQTSAVDALAAVLEPGFDPAIQAVVEGSPGIGASSAPPGTATYRELAPEDVGISVHAPAPSIVVVRNAWDPDWNATVDGSPAPVLRADYLLQGIPVPAGRHEISLTYHDPTIGDGLALSTIVWLALAVAIAAAATSRRRRRRRRAVRAVTSTRAAERSEAATRT